MTNLEVLRKRAKLTQQELADKVGVSRVTVARWEIEGPHARRPNKFVLRAIAEALNIPVSEIEFTDREATP